MDASMPKNDMFPESAVMWSDQVPRFPFGTGTVTFA